MFGDQALAWQAQSPSPGSVDFSGHLAGDLTGDSTVDADDVDVLFDEVRRSPSVTYYDLNDDGLVNTTDVTWLIENTLGTLAGDANLNGSVDADDFNVWRSNQFQRCRGWATADFNGDGITDGSDFNIWNLHRFAAVGAARGDALHNDGEARKTEPRAALSIPRANPAASEAVWADWISPRSTDTKASLSVNVTRENAAEQDSRPIATKEIDGVGFAKFGRWYTSSGHDAPMKPSNVDGMESSQLARLAIVDDWFANGQLD